MKYLSLSLLLLSSIFLMALAQSAHAQNSILDKISQALDRLASSNSQSTNNVTLPNAANNNTNLETNSTVNTDPTVNRSDGISSKVGNGTQIAVTTIGEALKGSGEYLNDTSKSIGSLIGKGIEGSINFLNNTAQKVSKYVDETK
jgi:hypothetical protein